MSVVEDEVNVLKMISKCCRTRDIWRSIYRGKRGKALNMMVSSGTFDMQRTVSVSPVKIS